MYRLQIFHKKKWRWGIVEYDNLESADNRVAELQKVGIKARVRNNSELFNSDTKNALATMV